MGSDSISSRVGCAALSAGAGMMSFPWASTKAGASCASVQPLLCSKPCDPIHQFQISAEILRLETGHAAAPIVVGEITKAGGPGSGTRGQADYMLRSRR